MEEAGMTTDNSAKDANKPATQDYRKELHEMLDLALDRMGQKMGNPTTGHCPSFSERERLAHALGKEIGGFLLEKSVIHDLLLQENRLADHASCPTCQSFGPRARDKDGKLKKDEITLKTLVGSLMIDAPFYWCGKCRRFFSPLERPSEH